MTRPFTPDHLWRLGRVGQPEPLPGGASAVVPVEWPDRDENELRTRLYLVSRDGATRPLTGPASSSKAPAVSPDGTRLAFLRTPPGGEKAQVHVMALDGGEAEARTDLPLGAIGPRWLPDGSGLVLLAPLRRAAPTPEGTAELLAAEKERTTTARTTEDRVYRYWDRWLTDGEVHKLFHLDLATGAVRDLAPEWLGWTRLMTPGGSFDVAPDGTLVAFTGEVRGPDADRLEMAVHVVEVHGGAHRRVSGEWGHAVRPRFAPDGSFLLYGVQREWDFYADRVRLARSDPAGGTEQVLTEDWDRSAGDWEFAREDRIVFHAEDRGRLRLWEMAPEPGRPVPLTDGESCHGPRPAGDAVWHRVESLRRPAEVAVTGPGGTAVVGSFNDEVMAGVDLGAVEEMEFAGSDGRQVQMFVVYPPGFDPARTWPLVHDIHGGPHGVSADTFHYRWNAQAFAAPGYVVALVNFHGSTSWGHDFAASIHGAWGDKPAADVLAATEALLERGFIDPDRMAITGGSYGGYLVSWLTTRTDRFAAAICHAGVTDLLGQWATDLTFGRGRSFGGVPWDGLEAIRRWSPLDHTAGIVTPTLVIHGERDYRVVVTQGLALYGILKDKGVPARLVYYPDEGHWILTPANSLHWYGEFLGWLDRWLGPAG